MKSKVSIKLLSCIICLLMFGVNGASAMLNVSEWETHKLLVARIRTALDKHDDDVRCFDLREYLDTGFYKVLNPHDAARYLPPEDLDCCYACNICMYINRNIAPKPFDDVSVDIYAAMMDIDTGTMRERFMRDGNL